MEGTKKIVWLDCDPGHDDAAAILLAALDPSLQLIGISTVFGNNIVDNTTNNALRVLKMGGIQNIDVFKGASNPLSRIIHTAESFHGHSGLDGAELPEADKSPIIDNVYYQIYQIIKGQKQKVNFVATGGLTNLAILIKTYPDFCQLLEQISIMGGCIGIGNWVPAAEFNIFIDPEAAKIVFGSGIKLTMVPIEVSHTVLVTDEIIKQIKEMKTNFANQIINLFNFFKQAYKKMFDFDFPPLHDPVAVYYIINPGAFDAKTLNVEIENKSEFCDGRTVVDLYSTSGRKRNCNVALKVNVDEFWKSMLQALALSNKQSPIN